MVSQRKLIGFWGVCAILASCSAQQHSVRRTHDESFVIAGGQTILLPVNEAGPISAENERVKILMAGFAVGPLKTNPKQAVLGWAFDFEIKAPVKRLEAVKVEEVSPSTSPVTLIEDNAPALKNGVWSGDAAPIPASRTSTPWLFENTKSVYVFRFTIKAVGEPPFVLYQPTWFSGAAKQGFQTIISNVEHG